MSYLRDSVSVALCLTSRAKLGKYGVASGDPLAYIGVIDIAGVMLLYQQWRPGAPN